MAPGTPRTGIRELAAATPAHRERSVDAVRALALATVVVGHWLAVVLVDEGDRLDGANLLHLWPPSQPLTWLFQVMPALFLVGGFANAASWRRSRSPRDGRPPVTGPAWVAARCRRLLVPTGLLVVPGAVVTAVAVPLGADPGTTATVAWLAVFALWFLALYVVLVAATPLLAGPEERHGWRFVAALAGLTLVADALAVHGGVPLVGESTYVLAWATVYTAGVAWQRHGWPVRRGVGAALLVGGLLAAVALVRWGPYPVGLLYTPGSPIQNASPPSAVLLAYAAAQTGLVLLLRGPLERVCQGRAWVPVVAVNAVAMTLYVWHMVPVVLVALPAHALGALAGPEPLTGAWFALRPVWLLACAVVLVPLVLAVARLERLGVGRPRTDAAAGRRAGLLVGLGVVVVALALVGIATGGLGTGGLAGVPWLPLVAFVLGALLVDLGARVPSSVDRASAAPAT